MCTGCFLFYFLYFLLKTPINFFPYPINLLIIFTEKKFRFGRLDKTGHNLSAYIFTILVLLFLENYYFSAFNLEIWINLMLPCCCWWDRLMSKQGKRQRKVCLFCFPYHDDSRVQFAYVFQSHLKSIQNSKEG